MLQDLKAATHTACSQMELEKQHQWFTAQSPVTVELRRRVQALDSKCRTFPFVACSVSEHEKSGASQPHTDTNYQTFATVAVAFIFLVVCEETSSNFSSLSTMKVTQTTFC